MRFLFCCLIFLFASIAPQLKAQIGGTSAFTFIDLDPSARFAALGGRMITDRGKDPVLGYQNPAMLNPKMHNGLSLSYNNYLADINNGIASYAREYKDLGTFSANVMFIHYGTFQGADENGIETKTFTAQDYNFQLGYGNRKKNWVYGANVKFLYSALERYVATAAAVDLGGGYVNDSNRWTATVLLRNVGYNLIPYVATREPIPTDLQIAFSQKLEHNPLRYTIGFHHLNKWDISYVNPNKRTRQIDLSTGEPEEEKVSMLDKAMWHMTFGAELIFSENFQLRLGYDHQRRKELAPEENKGFTGFSWGVEVGIKGFHISYGSAHYFPGRTASRFITVYKNLDSFFVKQ